MPSYKTEKEAFHAGNLGSSITSINAVSAVSLTSYLLYALLARHVRRSPVVDYLVTVLPLLLAVTVFSSRPYTFNIVLLLPASFILSTRWTSRSSNRPSGTQDRDRDRPSKGKWLDESDSDEEPAQQVLPRPTSASAPESSAPSPASASSTQLAPDLPEATARTFRRRHSPTPSTHTHTAIDMDVLPTPDLLGASSHGRFASQVSGYPSRSGLGTRAGSGNIRFETGRLGALSTYRAQMMVMTVLCILAVDFDVFPRKFGKCEDFGTSLMDVGVGSFVFSLGLVSVRNLASSGASLVSRLVKATIKASPALALGLVRVLMVKGAEYPEHVTEYGVHWNFFFTLGLLPILGTLLASIRRRYLRWSILGLLTTILHQLALSQFGLQSWVLSPIRTGLLGENKEGIVSLPGYLAIYALGLATGEHVARATVPPTASTGSSSHAQTQGLTRDGVKRHFEKRQTELCLELFGYAFGWWCVVGGSRLAGAQVSRRLANTPYVIWIAAYNTTFLLGYLLVETYLFASLALPSQSSAASASSAPAPARTTSTSTSSSSLSSASLAWPSSSPVPPLLEAINGNGLAVFLVANLLTGLINVTFQTMYLGTAASMAILVVYSAALCAFAWGMRRYRLRI